MSEPFVVIVTGSREHRDRALVWRVLDELLAEHGALRVHFGDCRTGADAHARDWTFRRTIRELPVHHREFPADWDRYGRTAISMRMRSTVAAGADLCVAFYQPGGANQEARIVARLAYRAGIPVWQHGLTKELMEACGWHPDEVVDAPRPPKVRAATDWVQEALL